MTIASEIHRIGGPIARGGIADLILPEYVMPTLMNTTIPTEADLATQSEIQLYPLGTKLRKHNSIWRYCRCGATSTALGFIKGCYTQIPGKAGNSVSCGFEGALYEAAVVGQTALKIADTAAAKNWYQGGLLTIYDDTNVRYQDYEIIGNDASTGVYTIIYIGDPGLKNAVSTSPGIDAYLSPYHDVRIVSDSSYMSALGYCKMTITTGYFFWLQTAGRISGITGASTWPGQTARYRDVYVNTDGSLIGYNAGYQRIGYLLFRTASDYGDNTIMLQLDQ